MEVTSTRREITVDISLTEEEAKIIYGILAHAAHSVSSELVRELGKVLSDNDIAIESALWDRFEGSVRLAPRFQ